jgi:hypothetical protein
MDPRKLPRQRKGITPQMHGRYPDYDVLSQVDHWDDVTRRVVLDRVERPPAFRFFDERERTTLKAFCDCMTAQDSEPRIPVLAYVDEKLFENRGDGEASTLGAGSFDELSLHHQHQVCHRFAKGELWGGAWATFNVARAFKVVLRDICEAFYAHPWAWNEIGFGGPAYPRGYSAFGNPELGEREPWEGVEAFELDPVPDVEAEGLD